MAIEMESPQGTILEVDEALAEILKAHKYKVVQRGAATSDKHTGADVVEPVPAAVVEPPADLPEPPAENSADTADDSAEPAAAEPEPAAETAAAPTTAKRGKK